MVLMRRKDKRRGNEAEEISVASDSSIVATKGMRSLGGARSGRFAADMRVNVGGYGRADKTWGVDHPWHQTQTDLFSNISSRDHMEEGGLVKAELESKHEIKGASRAALKKKKNKLKKAGMSPAEAAAAALAEIEQAKRDALAAAEAEQQRRAEIVEQRKRKKQAKRDAHIDSDIAAMVQEEAALDDALAKAQDASASAPESASSKKRKRVNRNRKRKAAADAATALLNDSDVDNVNDDDGEGDISDDEPVRSAPAVPAAVAAIVLDDKAAALQRAKKERRAKDKRERKEKQAAYHASVEARDAAKQAELDARELIARDMEAKIGTEVTTPSGLVVRDVRIGKGKLPDVGEMCTVKYKGKLGRDGLVFGRGMLTPVFGTASVIAGWEEGMGTMRPGGIRHLLIPPELGYGESSKGDGKIPPNSTLFFEVELIRFGKRKRETISDGDMPLPKAFQRRKIKEKTPVALQTPDERAKASKASGKHSNKRTSTKRR